MLSPRATRAMVLRHEVSLRGGGYRGHGNSAWAVSTSKTEGIEVAQHEQGTGGYAMQGGTRDAGFITPEGLWLCIPSKPPKPAQPPSKRSKPRELPVDKESTVKPALSAP